MDRWNFILREAVKKHFSIGETFTIDDIYRYEETLSIVFPNNNTARATLRRNLQGLRDQGIIKFVDNRGTCRRVQ